MKVKIINPNANTTTIDVDDPLLTPFLDLDDSELSKILTPSTEKLCFDLLGNGSNTIESPAIKTATTTTTLPTIEEELLASVALDHSTTTTTTSVPCTSNQAGNNTECQGDHAYSTPSNKRPRMSSSFAEDDFAPSSVFSDFSDVMTPSSTSKRQRTKGIYRARDVTNAVELDNYLERRKKNNISSKISRANKKNYYSEMEAKSHAIEDENARLALKINMIDQVNKIMKEYLKEAFVSKLN